MKRWMPMILVVVLMAGCATVQDFVQDPPDGVVTLKLPPEQAALCMTRNMEKKGSGYISDRRPMPNSGELEMIIRAMDLIYSVSRIKPQGSGSQATIWMATHVFVTKESIIADMVNQC